MNRSKIMDNRTNFFEYQAARLLKRSCVCQWCTYIMHFSTSLIGTRLHLQVLNAETTTKYYCSLMNIRVTSRIKWMIVVFGYENIKNSPHHLVIHHADRSMWSILTCLESHWKTDDRVYKMHSHVGNYRTTVVILL